MQDDGKDSPSADAEMLELSTPDKPRHRSSSTESPTPSGIQEDGADLSDGVADGQHTATAPSTARARSASRRLGFDESHGGGPTVASWAICTVLIVIDQITKLLADRFLVPGEPVPIIEGCFNLTLVYNPGAAFGMFGNLPDPYRRFVLAFVSLVALMVVVRFMIREARYDRISQLALVAILSGAIGNIIDRVRLDAVIDFLDFYWGSHHWPAFNVADSAISIGVTVLMLRVLFGRKMFHESRRTLEAATAKQQ